MCDVYNTSKTPNPVEIMKNADLIISCVGKRGIVTKDTIKPGVILISVGIWRTEDGRLHGDYEEDDIKNIASFYTPTPGGVGPLNIASLMQNLVKACTIK
jgi:methylenetetrahydrofolate dehydrogenase (NADP+)/methenyltetrahydrofolate cyclohydrolase